MAREFTVSSGGLTLVNAVVTLVFLNPPAAPNPSIEILRCWAGQSGSIASAMQRVQLVTQVTAFPTLTSATPRPTNPSDPNVSILVGGTAGAAGTCGINASAEGAGAKTVRMEFEPFNVLNGWFWTPTPDERIKLMAGLASGFGIYLPVAASTLTNWSCGITYREV